MEGSADEQTQCFGPGGRSGCRPCDAGTCQAPAAQIDPAILADKVGTLIETRLRAIAREPLVIDAIVAQNRITHAHTASVIARLDGDWRREVYTPDNRTLIPAVMGHPASHFLATLRDISEGFYTEFIVTDALGLNAALSDLTPDYWQGDEDKFLVPFNGGPGGHYLGPDEYFRGAWQRQIAIAVSLPGSIAPIGVLCAGVDTTRL